MLGSDIVVVSGLPRSGTSLMMQMLHSGGLEVVTDHIRTADTDNPRGYYELEKVKQLKREASWLPETRGKVFKAVSLLLYDLPQGERYRIILMERDLDETLSSQEKMLARLGRNAGPRETMKRSFTLHLEKLHDWLRNQRNMEVLPVRYSDLVEQPEAQAQRINAFLGGNLAVDAMVQSVDPSLYRNRKGEQADSLAAAARPN